MDNMKLGVVAPSGQGVSGNDKNFVKPETGYKLSVAEMIAAPKTKAEIYREFTLPAVQKGQQLGQKQF